MEKQPQDHAITLYLQPCRSRDESCEPRLRTVFRADSVSAEHFSHRHHLDTRRQRALIDADATPVAACTGGLYKGHDHLVGKAPTGDFNVAWHVVLLVFTQKAMADHSYNTPIMTIGDVGGAILTEVTSTIKLADAHAT